ncbi:MAG: MerR family transcriptional regulator, partial [Actinomycetota bacterium]|nr:MerR family transcriptional regulator [Actinomycetota bacterium]
EPPPAPPTGAGVRFSADELAAAVDAEASLVDELISYGLLSARTVAGVAVYDEDDLALARIAAGLRRFGIEARHLRSFKHAAEREASLYGQVVTPLLRQRNPAAHERAERDLQELAELGGALRSVFLKSVLRELTGG